MTHLHIDFESHSKVDLKTHGVDVYSRDPSTNVLMMGWSIDDGPERLWLPHEAKMPGLLGEMMADRAVRKIAHNAPFERALFENTLHVETPVDQWYCTMVMALSLGLPASLGQLMKDAFKTSREYWKDPEGEALMRMFSFPSSKATYETHPVEFARYGGYCKQDVRAEKKAYKIMAPLIVNMGKLFETWCLNEKINATGLPVDYEFIDAAKKLAEISRAEYKDRLREMTGLDNPGSTQQLQPWLQARGYPFSSIAKNRVKIALKDAETLTDEAKAVINVRLESNKTSLAKYDTIRRFSYERRLRNTFQCRGAGATGRYAGRILGQNMPRPDKDVEAYLAEAREMIAEEDLDGIKWAFGKPLEVLSSSIRSSIIAPPGKKLIVADLSSIELCVIAWLTSCKFWLDVVESGQDAYKAFGTHWLELPYEQITKALRFLCKPPALGCGYRMGPGFATGIYPDIEYTGLRGYAANMGVEMSREQCKSGVKVYRELSPEIVQSWYDLENAAMECVNTGETQEAGMFVFDRRGPFLRMRLPSGRFLHYCRPRIEMCEMTWEDENGEMQRNKKWGLTYERLSQATNKWVRRQNHGGRFIEQGTQAVALDLLDTGLRNADRAGFEIVGHYHDEMLTLVDEDSPLGLADLIREMTTTDKWAGNMPVSAAGYEGTFFKKD